MATAAWGSVMLRGGMCPRVRHTHIWWGDDDVAKQLGQLFVSGYLSARSFSRSSSRRCFSCRWRRSRSRSASSAARRRRSSSRAARDRSRARATSRSFYNIYSTLSMFPLRACVAAVPAILMLLDLTLTLFCLAKLIPLKPAWRCGGSAVANAMIVTPSV